MKWILNFLMIGCSYFISTSLMAQSIGIGIKAGPNFAKLDAHQSLSANYNSKTGFHFGAYALIKISKIGIQPELLYSKQGTSSNSNGISFNGDFSYLNIPIILKLYTVAGINLQVGPQIGFATSKNAMYISAAKTITSNQSIKGKDLSLALGLGWDLPFGLSIDVRYNLGLSDNNNAAALGVPGQIKNQVFMASVGYRLFKFGN